MISARLVLASKSPARRMVLENAGVPFDLCDADIDEDILKAEALAQQWPPEELATALAKAKAEAAAAKSDNKGAEVGTAYVGCDQLLALNGTIYDKPGNLDEAGKHLRALSGQTHQLISAVVVYQPGAPLWSHVETASMHVRPLSNVFIEDYLQNHSEGILSSVGAYRLEGYGAQMFEKIEGDYFTVLGLPLLPLLEELRKRGILAL
ncbi:MAG: Maf family nucleotide pyrophosphatase [Rhodospirillales bacterium]|nr:Maf family nucleotide pyrophosphatase [Rhodospirillales bacterium]